VSIGERKLQISEWKYTEGKMGMGYNKKNHLRYGNVGKSHRYILGGWRRTYTTSYPSSKVCLMGPTFPLGNLITSLSSCLHSSSWLAFSVWILAALSTSKYGAYKMEMVGERLRPVETLEKVFCDHYGALVCQVCFSFSCHHLPKPFYALSPIPFCFPSSKDDNP